MISEGQEFYQQVGPITAETCAYSLRTKSKSPFSEVTIMRHPFHIKTPDATFLALNQPHIFAPFFSGYLDLLKEKLSQVEVQGHGYTYSYFTCGQDHYPRNPTWKPWQHLEAYCDKTCYDFYEARDMIFQRIGRKLVCECELLRNDDEIRRRELGIGIPWQR